MLAIAKNPNKVTINKFAFNKHKTLEQLLAEESGKDNKIGWKNTWGLWPVFFLWFWILSIWAMAVTTATDFPAQAFAYNYFDLFKISGTGSGSVSPQTIFTLFTSVPLITNILILFPMSIMLDRFSIKKVIQIGLGLWVIALVGLLLSYRTPSSAFVFIALLGAAAPIVVLPNLKLSFQWFKPGSVSLPISLSIGLAITGGIVASFVAPTIFKAINGSQGTFNILPYGQAILKQGAVIIISIGLVVLVFFNTFIIREKKSQIKIHYNGLLNYSKNLYKVAILPRNWGVALMIALVNLPVSVLAWSLGPSLFGSYYGSLGTLVPRGTAFSAATAVTGVLLFGNFVGSFFFGWLADKLNRRKDILWISATILAGISFITIIMAMPAWVIFILFFVIGFFVGSQNVGYPMLTEQNKPEAAGSANTMNSIILLGLGAIVQNVISTILGNRGGNISVGIMIILPIAMSIPIIIGFFVRDTGPKADERRSARRARRAARGLAKTAL